MPYMNFLAVEQEAVVTRFGYRRRTREVVAGTRLLIRERHDLAAFGDRRQPRFALRFGGVSLNQPGRHDRARNERLWQARAARFELNGECVRGLAIETAVLGADHEPQHAEFRVGSPRVAAETVRLAARLQRIALFREAPQAVRELALFFAV